MREMDLFFFSLEYFLAESFSLSDMKNVCIPTNEKTVFLGTYLKNKTNFISCLLIS